jgi:hypothetical protein
MKALIAAVLTVAISPFAWAETQPVTLDPIPHHRAFLTVVGVDGAHIYDPASLEEIGARRMTTITPWRETPAVFEGVLLRDVLSQNGLEDAQQIRVIAENGYAVEINRDIWMNWEVLVATRVNGAPHSRRNRGPIQFVLPMSADAEAGAGHMASNWVWMAERIEAVN